MNKDQAAANLSFFQRELLEQRFYPYDILPDELRFGDTILSIFRVELSLWLQLGAGIGFFDKDQVERVLREKSLPRVGLGSYGSGETPKRLMTGDITEEEEADLVPVFRNHMLMTSEIMGDVQAAAFMEMLHAPDGMWARMVNSDEMWLGSFAGLCRGFAAILACLEGTIAISHAISNGVLGGSELPHASVMLDLSRILRGFQMPRLGLLLPEASRYFEFA